jgi:hypothetical protein
LLLGVSVSWLGLNLGNRHEVVFLEQTGKLADAGKELTDRRRCVWRLLGRAAVTTSAAVVRAKARCLPDMAGTPTEGKDRRHWSSQRDTGTRRADTGVANATKDRPLFYQ